MKKLSVETIAVMIAGFGTLILIYFAYQNSGSEGGGDTILGQNVSYYPIITAAPVDTAAIAGAQAQVRSAELQTAQAGWSSLVGFLLGQDNNRTAITTTGINADAQRAIAVTQADAERYIALQVGEATRYSAQQQAHATERQAYYNYEATRQQEKSKRKVGITQSIVGGIGSAFKGILKLF